MTLNLTDNGELRRLLDGDPAFPGRELQGLLLPPPSAPTPSAAIMAQTTVNMLT